MFIDITCPNCDFSRKVPLEKIPRGVRWATCPRCKKNFEFDLPNESFHDPADKESLSEGDMDTPSPWERRIEIGIWKGIWRTLGQALFSPASFFSGMRGAEGIKEPLAFGLLAGSIGTMAGIFWKSVFMPETQFPGTMIFSSLSPDMTFMILLILAPLMVTAGMFITSGLVHLFLRFFRGTGQGLEGTFRVIAFSQSTAILSLVPGIGGLAGSIWNIVIIITGLKNIHESTFSRVIAAVICLFITRGLLLIPVFILKLAYSGLFLTAF